MLGAISTALSGMNAFSQGPQAISDSTANLDTLGAKVQTASFEELFNAGGNAERVGQQPVFRPVIHAGDGPAGTNHHLHDGSCGVGHVLGWRGGNKHPPAGFDWPDRAMYSADRAGVE
ncbi:MAG TPA: hypothetical protein VG407_07210 [Caulobacteraceae bacterium]|nr:hypothetical protein [Caulobacteraceae bacterium]